MGKSYLGDSVYAVFVNGGIVLTTENGFGATNTIFLEPYVLRALNIFAKEVKESVDGKTRAR